MKSGLEPADYSVVVKNRARMPKPWRWEIYRAGRTSPIAHSDDYFELRSTANLEGKVALEKMLKTLYFKAPLVQQSRGEHGDVQHRRHNDGRQQPSIVFPPRRRKKARR